MQLSQLQSRVSGLQGEQRRLAASFQVTAALDSKAMALACSWSSCRTV